MLIRRIIFLLLIFLLLLSACSPSSKPAMILPVNENHTEVDQILEITPYPTRPAYEPGELVDYVAQTGDSLYALAQRFNTTVEEIRIVNPFIPPDATTMPPGMPMQIPIYYRALWGTPHQILPDSAFVNGPDATTFAASDFIANYSGWISNYSAWAFSGTRTAADIVNYVGLQYSISPKILLALLEYQGEAFTEPTLNAADEINILGLQSNYWTGVYLQLSYASNLLNDAYYRYREGRLLEFELADGSIIRPDPWQNAGTVALQYFFSLVHNVEQFHYAIGPDGFTQTYEILFGDPWHIEPHIAGSLVQPEMQLPYTTVAGWAFTGGPHTGWGSLEPWAALDFAPPSSVTGCYPTSLFATAVADGMVVRDGEGLLILDLDGDGDERTGWVVFYLHIAKENRTPVGTIVQKGDPLGHPSCEGGRSTGTHIHIARKYNGEWMVADGLIPFELSGWHPVRGSVPYAGWLVKGDLMVVANTNPDNRSTIPSD